MAEKGQESVSDILHEDCTARNLALCVLLIRLAGIMISISCPQTRESDNQTMLLEFQQVLEPTGALESQV